MFNVIIPYYQREPGILRKALASIDAQRGQVQGVHVVIVDDASPVPAAAELRDWRPVNFSMDVIVQPNAGPAAARNTGIVNAHASTRYIAFLDSDDEWTPGHLARAETALNEGYDIFFGDLTQLNQSVGAFDRAGRIRIADHPVIGPPEMGLHAYKGDMVRQIITGNLIGTPTVAYDIRRFPDLRFRTEYVSAGEDYLFWLDLTKAGARAVFSEHIEARCGHGVNVYSGSGWGTEQFAFRVHNEMRYRKTLLREFQLDPDLSNFVRQKIKALRRAFAGDIVHRLFHRKPLSRSLLRQQWSLDPMSFAQLPIVLYGKVRGQS